MGYNSVRAKKKNRLTELSLITTCQEVNGIILHSAGTEKGNRIKLLLFCFFFCYCFFFFFFFFFVCFLFFYQSLLCFTDNLFFFFF